MTMKKNSGVFHACHGATQGLAALTSLFAVLIGSVACTTAAAGTQADDLVRRLEAITIPVIRVERQSYVEVLRDLARIAQSNDIPVDCAFGPSILNPDSFGGIWDRDEPVSDVAFRRSSDGTVVVYAQRRISLKKAIDDIANAFGVSYSTDTGTLTIPAWSDSMRTAVTNAFADLYLRGLADVAGSTYVVLQGPLPRRSSAQVLGEGNAWLLELEQNGSGRFVINGCEQVVVFPEGVLAKLRKSEPHAAVERSDMFWGTRYVDGRIGGDWMALDLTNEIARVQAKVSGGGVNAMDLRQKARVFLFCANIFRHGFERDALRITRMLAGHGATIEALHGEAVSQIADARYIEASRRLAVDRDRSAFTMALSEIITDAGANWAHRATATRQLNSMQATPHQVGSATAPPEFLSAIDSGHVGDWDLRMWLLPGALDRHEAQSESDRAILMMLRRRMDAVPVLLGLLDDYTPVATPLLDYLGLTGPGWRCMTGWSYVDPFQGRITSSALLWPRATTRAEVAMGLLGSTIWLDDHEGSMSWADKFWLVPSDKYEQSVQEAFLLFGDTRAHLLRRGPILSDKEIQRLRAMGVTEDDAFEYNKAVFRRWYEMHKDMTDEELARDCIRCSYGVPQRAMDILVPLGRQEDIEVIEERLMSEIYPHRALEAIAPYVRLRGRDAEGFISRYEQAIEKHISEGLQRRSKDATERRVEQYEKEADRDRRAFERIIADLRAEASGGVELDTVLNELVNGTAHWNDAFGSLSMALRNSDPTNSVTKLLTAALESGNRHLKRLLIDSAGAMTLATPERGGDEVQIPVHPQHAPLWSALLEDVTPLYGAHSVATVAAVNMECLYGGADQMGVRFEGLGRIDFGGFHVSGLIDALGVPAASALVDRAKARLKGGDAPLPPIPSADRVPDQRRREIGTVLKGVDSAEEMRMVVDALNLDERLALPKVLEEDERLNRQLTPYANRVVSSILKDKDDEELAAQLKAIEGQILEPATVDFLLQLCRREAERGRFVSCNIVRHKFLQGIHVELSSMPPERLSDGSGSSYDDHSHMKAWVWCESGPSAFAIWPIEVSEDVRASVNRIRFFDEKGREIQMGGSYYDFEKYRENDEIRRVRLWEAVNYFLSSNVNAAERQSIMIAAQVGKNH